MKEERKILVIHNNLWGKVLRKNGKLIRKYLEVKVEVTENARKVVENVGKALGKYGYVSSVKRSGNCVVINVQRSVWYYVFRKVYGIKCVGKCVVLRVKGSVWY